MKQIMFLLEKKTGREERKELELALEELAENLQFINFTVEEKVIHHKIEWILVSDLKMTWELFSLCKGACPYCNCTSTAQRAEKIHNHRAYSRRYNDNDFI